MPVSRVPGIARTGEAPKLPASTVPTPESQLRRARLLGHRPAAAIPASPIHSRPEPIVQRDVGYEFETGWLVSRETAPHSGRFESLKKKDVVSSFPGFRVEADEAEEGQSEIEFVIDPPLPTRLGARDSLTFILNYIEIFGTDMLRAAQGNGFFRVNQITGRDAERRFVIRKRDEELKAGPQVTSGISLEKIAELGNLRSLPDELGRSVRTIQSITATIDSAGLADLLPGGTLSPPLRGLVSLLVSLLWGGENTGLEYPKQIADVFLLPRTDLVKAFSLLPESDRNYYSRAEGARRFMRMVLRAAGFSGTEDTPVIERGVRPRRDAPYVPVGPTRGFWLFAIPQGFDVMSREVSADFESMGALGTKTEAVGPEERQAPIFELRGAQTTKIPLPRWKPFALAVFDALIELEGPRRDERA